MYLLLTNNYIYAVRNRYNGNRDKGILKLNVLVIVFFYPSRNKTTSHEKNTKAKQYFNIRRARKICSKTCQD